MFSPTRKRGLTSRITATIIALMQLFPTLPASARPQVSFSSINAPACGLSDAFLWLHQTTQNLGQQARESGGTALRLRRTTRWYPYKQIEHTWPQVREDAEHALETVEHLPTELDQMPDDSAKSTALDLSDAYQRALDNIVDYEHAVLFYERAENNSSMIFAKQAVAFNFSLQRSKGRSFVDDAAHQFLDWRFTEINDSFRSLKLPEYRYGKLCNTLTSRPAVTVGNACELRGRLAELHSTIAELNSEALDAANTAKRLHHTSRWRPYKHVEHDWYDVQARTQPALERLSDFSLALDDLPNTEKKQDAQALTSAYQSSLLNILNYVHWAVYDERIENLVSMNLTPNVPTFGAIKDPTKASQAIFGRQMLDARLIEPGNAALLVKVPELRFRKACGASIAGVPVKIGSACALTGKFMILRTQLGRIGTDSGQLGKDTLRLRHTSRWIPYKRIERKWNGMAGDINPAMDQLAIVLLALDVTPNDARKQAALDLASAYQASLRHFVDYATYALTYERSENTLSMNFNPSYFNYGVFLTSTTMNRDTLERAYFEARYTENADAFRSLKLPEHHYLGLCKSRIPAPLVARVDPQ
jgi:hypothetical protein